MYVNYIQNKTFGSGYNERISFTADLPTLTFKRGNRIFFIKLNQMTQCMRFPTM